MFLFSKILFLCCAWVKTVVIFSASIVDTCRFFSAACHMTNEILHLLTQSTWYVSLFPSLWWFFNVKLLLSFSTVFFFFVYCFFTTGCVNLAYLMSFIFFLRSWREFNYQLELSSPLLSTFVMNSSNFPKEKN